MYPIAENFRREPRLKPTAKLIGENGNIFNLLGIARKSLRHVPAAHNEMTERVFQAGSYDEALQITMEYVDVE